jgi:hypothetical protein
VEAAHVIPRVLLRLGSIDRAGRRPGRRRDQNFITFGLGLVKRGDQQCGHIPHVAIVLWLADYSDGSLLRLRRRFERTSVDTHSRAPGDNIRGDRKFQLCAERDFGNRNRG